MFDGSCSMRNFDIWLPRSSLPFVPFVIYTQSVDALMRRRRHHRRPRARGVRLESRTPLEACRGWPRTLFSRRRRRRLFRGSSSSSSGCRCWSGYCWSSCCWSPSSPSRHLLCGGRERQRLVIRVGGNGMWLIRCWRTLARATLGVSPSG
jgi:hypothetical protein